MYITSSSRTTAITTVPSPNQDAGMISYAMALADILQVKRRHRPNISPLPPAPYRVQKSYMVRRPLKLFLHTQPHAKDPNVSRTQGIVAGIVCSDYGAEQARLASTPFKVSRCE